MTKQSFRQLFVLGLIISTWLFLKDLSDSTNGFNLPHADKVVHFVVFAGLSYILLNGFEHFPFVQVMFLSSYGFFIEYAQSYIPYRSASVGDLAADILGVLVVYSLRQQLKHKQKTDALI